MPRLDFAFIADAAEAEPGRKFYVLGGGVDSIGAQRFPVVHPHMALVLRLLVHPAEADRQHALEVKLIDADGHELARVQGSFSAAGPTMGRDIAIPLVMNFVNTRFEAPGDYALDILVGDQHERSLPLRVYQVGPPPGHPG